MDALQLRPMAAMLLEIYLAVIDVVSAYISECDHKLDELSRRDERIRRLQQIPGIAQVFGPMIVAEIGEISRFWTKKQFVAYCGLAPIVRQSADKSYTGPPRRDCNHWLRYAFIEAAHSCARSPGRYRDYYQRKVEQRDEKVAAVATARRLCRLVFALLHSSQHYRAEDAQAA
jgi:transposase